MHSRKIITVLQSVVISIIHSCVIWCELGERLVGKYLRNLEKKNEGKLELTNDPQNILNESESFYADLYNLEEQSIIKQH